MTMQHLSRSQFEEYKIDKLPTFVAKERKWYAHEEANLLGIVLEDNFDKDWSFLVLALDPDGWYRAIDVRVSMDTEEIASIELTNAMVSLSKSDQKEENIYQISKTDFELFKPVIGTIDDEVKKYFKKYPHRLYDLEPRKFEELVASIMEDLGFTVELTKATRDGGTDIIARIKTAVTDFVTHIECKRYAANNKVDVGIIRNVMGVHHLRKPAKSIIITTSFFTKDAIKEAKGFEHHLDLKDFNDIKDLLSDY